MAGQTLTAPDPSSPAPAAGRLRRRDLWEIFFRSFFLQTTWSFQRMQNLGWLFSFWPVLRRLQPDPAKRSRDALEHLEYFNTHPYLASLVLGVAAGLEEERANGGRVNPDQIRVAKSFMSGPLAALGDTFFWATLRPLLGVAALVAGWIFAFERWWAVPALFLGFYNVLHLLVRGGGVIVGYRLKAQVGTFLMRFNLHRVVQAAYGLGLGLALGALLALLLSFDKGRWPAVLVAAGSFAAARWGLSSSRLLYCVVAAGVGAALAGGF